MISNRDSEGGSPIPAEFFDGVAYLLPGLGRIAEKHCKITLSEWSVLWFLQRSCIVDEHGRPTILRQELTAQLTERGFSPAAVTKLVASLQKKRLILRSTITPEERMAIFRSAEGPKLTVTLLPAGSETLKRFADTLAVRFDTWRKRQPPLVRTSFKALKLTAIGFAEWLTKRPTADGPE